MTELDEVRAILLQTAQQQQRTQQQLDQLSSNVAAMSQILKESIPDLTEMVGTVLQNLDVHSAELGATFAADKADRAADRVSEARMRNEFRSAIIGIQSESRNILRELAELRRLDDRRGA